MAQNEESLGFFRTSYTINYVHFCNNYCYFYTHKQCSVFIIIDKFFKKFYLLQFKVEASFVKLKVKIELKVNYVKQHEPEQKNVVIHPSVNTLKQIIPSSPSIGDNYKLSRKSKSSISVTQKNNVQGQSKLQLCLHKPIIKWYCAKCQNFKANCV